jgi:hypothetical protein
MASADCGKACALPIDISEAFVADILRSYRANAKYLKSAQITQIQDADRPARDVPIGSCSRS